MGIDYHALQFLRYTAKRKQFGATATIGRQGLYIAEAKLRRVMNPPSGYKHDKYCDGLLLEYFGATYVESFDNSSYEAATFVVDLNKPLECDHKEYETVIDAGCVEHIFNVPNALDTISALCCEGGQILHILPANNYCGHGFWQFSPELFFSLYSQENGYGGTEVFLADLSQEEVWYQVIRPENGRRAETVSSTPLVILCRTTKGAAFSHNNVQQSDYVYVWDQHATNGVIPTPPKMPWVRSLKMAAKRSALAGPFLDLFELYRLSVRRGGTSAVSGRNPHLIERRIASLV